MPDEFGLSLGLLAIVGDANGSPADGVGGRRLLTDRDATAMAATAASQTAPARADLAQCRNRAVITDARPVPLLRRLPNTAGIGEIDSWKAWDAVVSG